MAKKKIQQADGITAKEKAAARRRAVKNALPKRPRLTEIQRKSLVIEMCRFFQRKEFTIYSEVLHKDLFETERNYRGDFYIVKGDLKFMIEINGGQNVKSRHTSNALSFSSMAAGFPITDYENDLIKMNVAQLKFCPVIQYTYEMLYFLQYEKDFSQF